MLIKNLVLSLLFVILFSCDKKAKPEPDKKQAQQQKIETSSKPNSLPNPEHEMAKAIDPKKFPNYIPWKTLKGLELIRTKKKDSGRTKVSVDFKIDETVQSLLDTKKTIKILGFMVPLDYNDKTILEFLLIPNPMSCSHLPPPAPNQMILVKMKKNSVVEYHWGPMWVDGQLSLARKADVEEEKPSFEMKGLIVSKYDQSQLSDDVKKTIKQGTP